MGNEKVINEITETVEERARRINKQREMFEKERGTAYRAKYKKRRNKELEVECISTGFEALDKGLGGGLPVKSITCISAAPSVGKSTFLLQMAEQMASQEIDIIYFNFEMSTEQMINKSHARNCFLKLNKNQDKGIMGSQIVKSKRWNELNEEQWDISELVASDPTIQMIDKHIYYTDCTLKPLNIDQINAKVAQWIETFRKTPVIVIDYLHMIVSPIDDYGKSILVTDKQILDYNMRGIRKMASEYRTPVIFISALKKDDFKSLADMSSLSGSSGIPYNCDIIISLQYGKLDEKGGKEKFDLEFEQQLSPRRIMAVITKNRLEGVGGKIRFDYYSKFDYFDDAANGSQGYRNKSTKEDVSGNEEIKNNKPQTKAKTKCKEIVENKNVRVEHEAVDINDIDMRIY